MAMMSTATVTMAVASCGCFEQAIGASDIFKDMSIDAKQGEVLIERGWFWRRWWWFWLW
jgi:hypothetical protein